MLVLLALHALCMIWLAFQFDGTGDEGDSIFHFLYSKYAFEHPENFLNHWAKPVFVLFTAPIAQLGFIAMKIFNILLLSGAGWLTWLIGRRLNIQNSWLALVVVLTAPMNVYLTLSGLTEPMFTFWMLLGIYGLMLDRDLPAVLWLSFLPFVRSEGLIVFCVVAIYLLLKKRGRLIPLLMTGHVVYALVGFPYYRDLFWIFNKMSYAVMKSSYGAGTLEHFAIRMPAVIGTFQTGLLIFGLLIGAIRLINYWRKKSNFSRNELWLIYGLAIAYFIAHSLFWYLGIFNSFGLMRVMICVVPLFGLMMVQGINFSISNLSFLENVPKMGGRVGWGIIAAGIIFFSLKKVNPEHHLSLKPIQQTQKKIAEKYGERYKNYTVFFDAIYPAVVFDRDWFDAREHRLNRQFFTKEPIPKKSIAIWDSWFSPVERNVDLEDFSNNPRFKLIECFEEKHPWDKKIKRSCLFEFDSTFSLKNPTQTESTVLINDDFEDQKFRSKVDSTQSVSGNYSLKILKTMPAWGSQQMFMNAFEEVENSKIKISFNAFLPENFPNEDFFKKGENQPVVRCEFISRYKIFKETEIPVFTENDTPGKWKFVELTTSFPARKDVEDRVRIFVRNKNEQAILIDNLEVVWLSGR